MKNVIKKSGTFYQLLLKHSYTAEFLLDMRDSLKGEMDQVMDAIRGEEDPGMNLICMKDGFFIADFVLCSSYQKIRYV